MRLISIFFALSSICGCNLTSGESVNLEVKVVSINGSNVVLEHSGAPELDAGTHNFRIDPNLARRVGVGDRLNANIIIGEQPQVIGFAPSSNLVD